jgi:hypothetical protein
MASCGCVVWYGVRGCVPLRGVVRCVIFAVIYVVRYGVSCRVVSRVALRCDMSRLMFCFVCLPWLCCVVLLTCHGLTFRLLVDMFWFVCP